jgi:hypothetical protein
MTIERDHASESLKEIESVARRTREALVYGGASASLIVWGVIVAFGYLMSFFRMDFDGKLWVGILASGMVFTVVNHAIRPRSKTHGRERRLTYAILVLVAFGTFWAFLIGARGRELGAFWPTLFMFGYVVTGFWLGRFFTWCGVAVTALTIIGYFWAVEWFSLWQAVVNGVGLISGGLWLRKVGSTP